MRRIIICLASVTALACGAAQDFTGRWAGRAQVPGRDVRLVVDLARDSSGAWTGSLIIPGFDVKGAPLRNLEVKGDSLAFDIGDALGPAPFGPATFKARLGAQGAMAGEMKQAGNSAPFTLKRVGEAQVEAGVRSTAVSRGTEGRWVGEFVLSGYPRKVTFDIANHPGAPASVDFVVIGKATTQIPVDFVSEEEGLLRVVSNAYRVTFEGRTGEGTIVGTVEIGPLEFQLTLRREEKAS